MSKHLVHSKITTFVNEDTGEVIQQEESKVIAVKVSEEAFFQTYIKGLSSFYKLTSAIDLKLIVKFCEIAEFNTGIVKLIPADRKDICEELGITTPSLSRSMKSLKDKGLIKETGGRIVINPVIYWKGDKKERAKLLKEGRMSVTINFEAND